MGAPNVIAGLLGCSVATVFTALIPNVLVVSPWVVVGALYVRGADGSLVTIFVAISLCAAAGFALFAAQRIQDVLDKRSAELHQPLEKFIELDWLDHRSEEISKGTIVKWTNIPVACRVALVLGALVFVCIGNVITHMGDAFFGSFAVTDDLDTLKLFGADGLVKNPGRIALSCSLVALLGLVVSECWIAHSTREPRQRLAAQMDQEETIAAWKEKRRKEIAEAEKAIIMDTSETAMEPTGSSGMGVQISVYGRNAEANNANVHADNIQITFH